MAQVTRVVEVIRAEKMRVSSDGGNSRYELTASDGSTYRTRPNSGLAYGTIPNILQPFNGAVEPSKHVRLTYAEPTATRRHGILSNVEEVDA